MTALSVIIPVHNEATRLPHHLPRLLEWLPRDAEVIIADNGSTDATDKVARDWAARDDRVVFFSIQTRGKGAAVRLGMSVAHGDICMFADADLSTPPREWTKLLRAIHNGADVAIASRRAPGAQVECPLRRRLMSRVFTGLVHHHFPELSHIQDTQCGFKAFTRKAAEAVFPLVNVDGMAFDVQVLSLAVTMDLRIAEVGVYWQHDGDSRVTFWDPLIMYAELLEARRSTLMEAPA